MLLAFLLVSGAVSVHPQALWIDVPFVPQKGEGCGAASIAMVMQYWQRQQGQEPDRASDYQRIEQVLEPPDARGILASAMERYFQQNGFRVFAFAGRWSDLGEQVTKGRPLIAAVKPGPGLPLHYLVVAGVDSPGHMVLLNDPAQRKLLKEDQARFEKEWKAAGNWTLLAVPDQSEHK